MYIQIKSVIRVYSMKARQLFKFKCFGSMGTRNFRPSMTTVLSVFVMLICPYGHDGYCSVSACLSGRSIHVSSQQNILRWDPMINMQLANTVLICDWLRC